MFILSATVNSIYSLSWDIWMDWGLARRNTKHWMLRAELSAPPWFYYAAVVLDLVLRFAWVQYLPAMGRMNGAPSVQLRGFLTALLEVGRRVMWNFLRGESNSLICVRLALRSLTRPPLVSAVESEHLGNVDGYRVTRQIPLPYVTLDAAHSAQSDEGADDGALDASLSERALNHVRAVMAWPGQAAWMVGQELKVVLHPRKARAKARTREEGEVGGGGLEEEGVGGGRKADPSAPFTPRAKGRGWKGEVAESSTDETGGSEGEDDGEDEGDDEAWDAVEEGRWEGEGGAEGEERVQGMGAVDRRERGEGVLR